VILTVVTSVCIFGTFLGLSVNIQQQALKVPRPLAFIQLSNYIFFQSFLMTANFFNQNWKNRPSVFGQLFGASFFSFYCDQFFAFYESYEVIIMDANGILCQKLFLYYAGHEIY